MLFSTIKRLFLCWRQDETEATDNERIEDTDSEHPRLIEQTQRALSRAGLIDIPEPQN
jgi:hypothetical protein